MCVSKPSSPKVPDPIVIEPEQEKKIELNPKTQEKAKEKIKRAGTRSLQIPMGGTGGEQGGLNIPRKHSF
jgi:hypothetical protein